MKLLPDLILRAAGLFLVVHFVPLYGDLVVALFDPVSLGLTLAQARI